MSETCRHRNSAKHRCRAAPAVNGYCERHDPITALARLQERLSRMWDRIELVGTESDWQQYEALETRERELLDQVDMLQREAQDEVP